MSSPLPPDRSRRLLGYHSPSREAFRQLWSSGTFFLDANVLLNLYRYPAEARADLLRVLRSLGDRIRVPFQALLEFERNRLQVISDQTKKFREVRTAVSSALGSLKGQLDNLQLKKRHSSINPDIFLAAIDGAAADFSKELDNLELSHLAVGRTDDIREYVYSLLGSRIGDPPTDQEQLDRLYAVGAKRYARHMPPGYMDLGKTDSDDFDYGGLMYKRSFGDLLLWEQMISACDAAGTTHAILVTDDDKEDWWWTVDSQGPKRIGPRPELVEEIARRARVEVFHMYNSEQLVKWSEQFLNVSVHERSIAQIRDARQTARSLASRDALNAEDAVMDWLLSSHENPAISRDNGGFPAFVVTRPGGRKIGYEVVAPRLPALLQNKLREIGLRAHYLLTKHALDHFTIVIVGASPAVVTRAKSSVELREGEELFYRTSFVIGKVTLSSFGSPLFSLVSITSSRSDVDSLDDVAEPPSDESSE
jgi:hypothetical protein